ncbi:MAG: hypothetical protein GX282_06920 [Campylobacteraceae bacterium]|nr:hypothetical protein [Campylobacteraceae bacterium]
MKKDLKSNLKVGIVGAGNIGSNIAYMLLGTASKIALIDIYEDFVKGRALDIKTASVIAGEDVEVTGGTSYESIKEFDIVVITAGATRKVGQSRDELASINAQIVSEASKQIAKFAPSSTIIVVTNPLDLMVYVAYKASGFNRNRVLGMAGELDTARANLIDKNAKVFGFHNDEMLIESSLKGEEFEKLETTTKNGGATITKLVGTSAYFAPAMGVVKMIKAMQNGGTVIASVLDEGEIPFGREVELDRSGVKNILQKEIYNKVDVSNIKRSIENL